LSIHNEFERVCADKKPMASYYKVAGEDFYYDNWEKYAELCKMHILKKERFYIKNNSQSFKIIYECFSKPENAWRVELYKSIKKIGQSIWNDDLEKIEGILLGYEGIYKLDQ